MADPPTVLHLAPHPDDEVIGAPATLLRLQRAGHRVINLACSLGRPDQHDRRRAEVEVACERAGFELQVMDPPLGISRGDDLEEAQRTLVGRIREIVETEKVKLVVSPTPHDGHHGHEVVGRAARDALAVEDAPRLWMWAIWSDLPLPTLYAAFGEEELAHASYALCAHRVEVERNDYVSYVRCRGVTSRVLGAERVFEFGAEGRPEPYADLLTEVQYADDDWWAGAPRELDPAAPLAEVPRDRPLGWWMRADSLRVLLREESAKRGSGAPSPSS